MTTYRTILVILCLLLLVAVFPACNQAGKPADGYLTRVCDSTGQACGYANQKGKVVIANGKYEVCFTDTFRTYAIVVKRDSGIFEAINRDEKVLYQVFGFDNGPDESSDGLFRIIANHKIGYADSATGNIVINPMYDCAFPFVNGVAQVSIDCKTVTEGEHQTWISEHWIYIDKNGKRADPPKIAGE